MPKKLTYNYIKEYIEKYNYKLISKEYISAHTKLNILCDKNHNISIKWNDFQQGVRCNICNNKSKIGRNKLTYEYVYKNILKEKGYELISKEYKNNTEPLLIYCDKGHKFITNWKNWKNGNRCPICYNKYKRLESLEKGRKTILERSKFYNKNNIPIYDTYASQLEWCEEVKRNKDDPNILEVRCFKCGKWFVPKLNNVNNRIQVLKESKKFRGEYRFYCSDECKNSCSIYGKSPETIMKEDAIRIGRLSWLELKREVQPELRQLVLERDKYKCQKCSSNKQLQCHHILPITIEPLLSADINNCVTLCSKCHKEVHKKDGCRYNQLKMEEC